MPICNYIQKKFLEKKRKENKNVSHKINIKTLSVFTVIFLSLFQINTSF
jgi:hypothetical protein